jgi:hypothetical protein
VVRFHVLETPLALDRYKQASTELLAMLDRVVYQPFVRIRRTSLADIRSGSGPAGSRSRSRPGAAASTT